MSKIEFAGRSDYNVFLVLSANLWVAGQLGRIRRYLYTFRITRIVMELERRGFSFEEIETFATTDKLPDRVVKDA